MENPAGNENETGKTNPALQVAVVIVLFEYVSWLFTTIYYFNSLYSTVSYLDSFIFGFPLACLILHVFGGLTFYIFGSSNKRQIAKYAMLINFFLFLISYISLFAYLNATWHK